MVRLWLDAQCALPARRPASHPVQRGHPHDLAAVGCSRSSAGRRLLRAPPGDQLHHGDQLRRRRFACRGLPRFQPPSARYECFPALPPLSFGLVVRRARPVARGVVGGIFRRPVMDGSSLGLLGCALRYTAHGTDRWLRFSSHVLGAVALDRCRASAQVAGSCRVRLSRRHGRQGNHGACSDSCRAARPVRDVLDMARAVAPARFLLRLARSHVDLAGDALDDIQR